jgi:hypothetical protein
MTFLPEDIEKFFDGQTVPKQTVFKIESDSDAGKFYTVDIAGPPTCDCIAYRIARNRRVKELGLTGQHAEIFASCKHIGQVLDGHGD